MPKKSIDPVKKMKQHSRVMCLNATPDQDGRTLVDRAGHNELPAMESIQARSDMDKDTPAERSLEVRRYVMSSRRSRGRYETLGQRHTGTYREQAKKATQEAYIPDASADSDQSKDENPIQPTSKPVYPKVMMLVQSKEYYSSLLFELRRLGWPEDDMIMLNDSADLDKALYKHRPDILFVDLYLQPKHGLDVIKSMEQRYAKKIVLTVEIPEELNHMRHKFLWEGHQIGAHVLFRPLQINLLHSVLQSQSPALKIG